jgi:hypothetical protein
MQSFCYHEKISLWRSEILLKQDEGKEWSHSTYKRYINIGKSLEKFERVKKYKLTFNKVNEKFHTEFTDYCMNIEGI